jgi:hypothetical protein
MTRFFINDVGDTLWEEIDEAQAGADYGWNCREGTHTNSTSGLCNPALPNMVDPIYEYGHDNVNITSCKVITGGAFVPNGVWPAEYDSAYLFADLNCAKIFRLQLSGSGVYTATEFAIEAGGPVHMTFGPTPGNAISVTMPNPEDLAAATTSYLELGLTATDSTGLMRVITLDQSEYSGDLFVCAHPAVPQVGLDDCWIAAHSGRRPIGNLPTFVHHHHPIR